MVGETKLRCDLVEKIPPGGAHEERAGEQSPLQGRATFIESEHPCQHQ
jgi:hypothetical protein